MLRSHTWSFLIKLSMVLYNLILSVTLCALYLSGLCLLKTCFSRNLFRGPLRRTHLLLFSQPRWSPQPHGRLLIFHLVLASPVTSHASASPTSFPFAGYRFRLTSTVRSPTALPAAKRCSTHPPTASPRLSFSSARVSLLGGRRSAQETALVDHLR